MKKILIIEDDPVLAGVCQQQLADEGYQVQVAPDGESGLETMRAFQPDTIILDLVLPQMSGPEVIRQIRADEVFSKIPIIVFSNTFLADLIQECWKAGATKFISKSNCSPTEIFEVVCQTIGDSDAAETPTRTSPKPTILSTETDFIFQADLRRNLVDSLPATLVELRAALQILIKAGNETARLDGLKGLYRRVHALAGNAGVAGLALIANMASALEALLKELHEKPANINPSTFRTVAAAVDFLGFLFERGAELHAQKMPAANILVVDDEPISRRAITYALEKAQLQSTNVESAETAYKLLAQTGFDLIFLDVDMPGMSGFELCTKLRALPAYKKTPVVFVTALSDFDNRTSSTMAGGNDFIAKPFLFIELTVKALIHVLRGKLPPAK